MLTRLCTGRRHIGSRAIFAALLFTILLIVVAVLPHEHAVSTFDGKGHVVVLADSSASCPLCDWLSTPHLAVSTVAPAIHIACTDWEQADFPALSCVPGFAVLRESPQRGPPAPFAG